MLKMISVAVVGGVVYLAVENPHTRALTLSAGRTVSQFVNRNSKTTDEYFRCMELNPKQPEECSKRFKNTIKQELPKIEIDLSAPDAGRPTRETGHK